LTSCVKAAVKYHTNVSDKSKSQFSHADAVSAAPDQTFGRHFIQLPEAFPVQRFFDEFGQLSLSMARKVQDHPLEMQVFLCHAMSFEYGQLVIERPFLVLFNHFQVLRISIFGIAYCGAAQADKEVGGKWRITHEISM